MRIFLKGLRGVCGAVLAAFAAILLACIPVATAHADVNDFIVTNFSANYTLTNDDPQGEMHVTERISVHFNDYNHGILRAIPTYYKKHRLQVQINTVTSSTNAPATYTTYASNGNMVLKIGDAGKTITGDQQYTIDYIVRNVIGFYKDHDELYWDVNGDQWQQPFQGVSVSVSMPNKLELTDDKPQCFTGSAGNSSSDCAVNINKQRQILEVATVRPLDGGETLTFVAGFKKGFFRASSWQDTLGEYSGMLAQFFVPLFIIGGAAAIYWLKRGRDAHGRGVIVPEYDAPDNMRPIEVGTIIDFKTDNKDITATIIDLAVRGYIKIIEQRTARKLRSDLLAYTFKLMKIDTSELAPPEEKLLRALFANFQMHEEVSMDFMKYKLAQKALDIRKMVSADLTNRGYFATNPFTIYNYYVGGAIGVIVIVCFVLALLHGALPIWVGTVAGFGIALIFLHFLPARTLQGAHAKEHILGLKMYLQTAEADRLRMMQSPNAPFLVGNQPTHTVELFEKLLPYAMVLGVEKEWAKQFEDIYKSPPEWFSGNINSFNAVYLASAISDSVQTSVNTVFSAPASSSTSGFSGGGGFAGGGGGGGGGGGW
jgi:uncharacterized membrane protein